MVAKCLGLVKISDFILFFFCFMAVEAARYGSNTTETFSPYHPRIMIDLYKALVISMSQ